MQNWTCDPKSGSYTYTGWLVNATDAKTGVHTGECGEGPPFLCAGRDQQGLNPCNRLNAHCSLGGPASRGTTQLGCRCCTALRSCPRLALCRRAGFALTVPGPSGTHVPFFVATDEANSTVLGTLINVREAGSVDMPR